ncbi:MAG: hybrid sensor histidine kinase/response regulator, partial [Thermochromatium sp.]
MLGAAGETTGVFVCMLDLTETLCVEQALREADRRKDEFLAVLGDELRNPVAPIRHAVAILRALGVDGDPRIHWAIEVLDRQTAHMGRLLDDLLDVSRIVQGRIELEPFKLQVRKLVQQAADEARALMEEHRHRFVCRLPVLTDAPRMNVSASPDDPPAPPAGEKPRVLVVDDDPDVVDALAMLLEILGYPVDVARCGPDALELVQRQCPRVALLDIGLPGMDGLEIARRLRADYPDPKRLKLVALTGLGHEQARERSLAA